MGQEEKETELSCRCLLWPPWPISWMASRKPRQIVSIGCHTEKLPVLVTSVLMLIGTVHYSIMLFIILGSKCEVRFIMQIFMCITEQLVPLTERLTPLGVCVCVCVFDTGMIFKLCND